MNKEANRTLLLSPLVAFFLLQLLVLALSCSKAAYSLITVCLPSIKV